MLNILSRARFNIQDRITSLEDFGGQAYYKRFDDGLNYVYLDPNNTQITYTGIDKSFTSEDLGKSFCGLFAHNNPAAVSSVFVNEYFPGLNSASRYSTVINVIDDKNIIVNFGYNLNVTNGKGYVFFDNSAAWDRMFNSLTGSIVNTKIRIKEHTNPLDVYVVPRFTQKTLPNNRSIEISTGTANYGRIKIGYEDYFQWGAPPYTNNPARAAIGFSQSPEVFNIGTSATDNFVCHNIYWLPPHRRVVQTDVAADSFFSGNPVAENSKIVAILNNRGLEEEREMSASNSITQEVFWPLGLGFLYAGGTYTGPTSSISSDIKDYIYVFIKNYEHQGQGFMDLKGNSGGGLYFVADNVYTDYLDQQQWQPTYFISEARLTASFEGLDPALKVKPFFPDYTFEFVGRDSYYKTMNNFWINSWSNAGNWVQIGRFAFPAVKPNWWKFAYNLWYNRGLGTASFNATGPDVFSGKKIILNHIARSGSTYTFGRNYRAVPEGPFPSTGSIIPNQIRNSIAWSTIYQKLVTTINPVTDVPANCFPMDMHPGDQFKLIVEYSASATLSLAPYITKPNIIFPTFTTASFSGVDVILSGSTVQQIFNNITASGFNSNPTINSSASLSGNILKVTSRSPKKTGNGSFFYRVSGSNNPATASVLLTGSSFIIRGSTLDGSFFQLTGSTNLTTIISGAFFITSSTTQIDVAPRYYIVTGSTAENTAINIVNKINSLISTFNITASLSASFSMSLQSINLANNNQTLGNTFRFITGSIITSFGGAVNATAPLFVTYSGGSDKDDIYTVTTVDRGQFPEWRDEIYDWSGGTTAIRVPGVNTETEERKWPYNFTAITLNQNLPPDLPYVFELTVLKSGVEEELINGSGIISGSQIMSASSMYKANQNLNNLYGSYTTSSKVGDENMLLSDPLGHVSYNHAEITLWVRDFRHNGFYRMSTNTIPSNFTIRNPQTALNQSMGPLRKYSNGYTFISSSGFVGELGNGTAVFGVNSPQGEFYARDMYNQSVGIFLPENEKPKVRLYNCSDMGVFEYSNMPYIERYPDTSSAPPMPQRCKDLLNSLPGEYEP